MDNVKIVGFEGDGEVKSKFFPAGVFGDGEFTVGDLETLPIKLIVEIDGEMKSVDLYGYNITKMENKVDISLEFIG